MNPDTDNSDNCSVQPFKKWKKEESSPGKSNGNGCSQTEIHSLPTEMMDKILDNLKTCPEAAWNARIVCHKWKDIMQPKLPFGGKLDDKSIQTLASLSPDVPLKWLSLVRLDSYRIGVHDRRHHETQHQQVVVNPDLLSRPVEHLIIGGDVGGFLKSKIDEDEPLYSLSTGFAENQQQLRTVESSISGTDLLNILPQLKDVKILTLTSIAFLSVSLSTMKRLNFSNQFATITKLDLCIGAKTDVHKIMAFMKSARCPHLTALYIRAYACGLPLRILITYFCFIAKHPLLKNLSISQSRSQMYHLSLEEMTELKDKVHSYLELQESLMKIKLECLRLDCIGIGLPLHPWRRLEKIFLQNQTDLRSLELQVSPGRLACRLDDLLPPCGDTLERLEISSTSNGNIQFNCDTIGSFKKLTQCHLYLKIDSSMFSNIWPGFGISHIDMLPASITSLHLEDLPGIHDVKLLRNRLVNLARVSYVGPETICRMSEMEYFIYLIEHLKFPKLIEYRIYLAFGSSIVNILNDQKGLICYIEDEESVVVYIDREEFCLERMLTTIELDALLS